MPELTLYHLDAPGVFHFGVRGVEQEQTGLHFPSDSLFAAIFNAWLEQGLSATDLSDHFPQPDTAETVSPPFLLTSVFPRAGTLRFYPMLPLSWLFSQAKLGALHQSHRLKEVKKIKFLSEGLFKRALAGSWLDDYLPANKTPTATDQGIYLQEGALWLDKTETTLLPAWMQEKPKQGDHLKALRKAKIWHVDQAPRVTVDRLTNASKLFHTGRLRSNRDCGLWFGLRRQTDDAMLIGGIEQALGLLADGGLGAERNAGYGHFKIAHTETTTLPIPKPGQFFVTLSRYNPAPPDLPIIFADPGTAYNLTSVAGWLKSPVEAAQRRRRLWLIEEGSVLQQPDSATTLGQLVDVRPVYKKKTFSHPVWRYGLAFPVQIKPAGGSQ